MSTTFKNVHWTITGFMTQALKLKGVELNIYAIINGFSQSQQGEFYGSISRLESLLSVSRPAVIGALSSLYSKQLIIKINRVHNKNHYRINEQTIQNISNNSTNKIEIKAVKIEDETITNDNDIAQILYNCGDNLLINIAEELTTGSKKSLLSSLYKFKLYLNNNKFIFKAVNKVSFKDFEIKLALKLSELTGHTFLNPSKVIKRYNDLTKSFFESRFDFNDCIFQAYKKAKDGDANYRQHNYIKALLIFLREGGENIAGFQSIENKIDRLINKIKRELEDEKLEAQKLEQERLEAAELEAAARKLNLSADEYQMLKIETYKHNVFHGQSFSDDPAHDVKEFIRNLGEQNIDYKKYLEDKIDTSVS